MSEEIIKHIEFIQSVITRMNSNSFQIKNWTITIVSALLALYASTKNETFILVSILPVIIFWLLDSYYLMQERKFRGLYNDVAGISDTPQKIKLFEMRPDLYTGGKYSFFNTFKSVTLFNMYFPLLFLLIITYFYLKTCS